MSDKKITILVNVRINSIDRLQHLKDSFFSFNTISDNWLINIRGDFRKETIDFLKNNLKDKAVFFELLDDSRGWIINALEMIKQAKYNYFFVWNEDHLNIASQDVLKEVIDETIENNADYLLYSYYPHWHDIFGAISIPNIIKYHKNINMTTITRGNLDIFFPRRERLCIVAGAAVFKKDFLLKVMNAEKTKLPIFFTDLLYSVMTLINRMGIKFNKKKGYDTINKIFFYKLRRFPKETPFELEITQDRKYILPIRMAAPKQELFACIDDDINYPGSQLIKRGLYPVTVTTEIIQKKEEVMSGMEQELIEKNDDYTIIRVDLRAGKGYTQRYYEDNVRTHAVLKKTLILTKGNITLTIKDVNKNLSSGMSISLYPNIEHTIKANEDSKFIVIFSSLHNKNIKQAI